MWGQRRENWQTVTHPLPPVFLDLRILKELEAQIVDLRILKGLADLSGYSRSTIPLWLTAVKENLRFVDTTLRGWEKPQA